MIRGNEKFVSQIYVLIDVICILLGFLMAWWVKFLSPIADTSARHLPFQTYLNWGMIYCVLAVGLGYFFILYSQKRKLKFATEIFKVLQAHSVSLLFLLSILFMLNISDISREFLFFFITFNLIFIAFYRLIVKLTLRHIRRKGYNKQFVLVLGAGTVGRQFYDNLKRHPELGFDVVGFLDDYQSQDDLEDYMKHIPILGKVETLEDTLAKHPIDEVVIALPLSAHSKFQRIVYICEKAGVRALIIPDYHEILPARPRFDLLGDLPLINIRDVPLDELRNRFFKRVFDIVFSFFAILLMSPIMLAIAVGIKVSSPGPILFKQERIGMNNRPFMMYKFRSMKQQTESDSDTVWTVKDDPRKTAIGTFIRKTSLDELPQFFNVIKGDMSVVGPRPERSYFVDEFKEKIPKYMVKHHVRPGITGWAQVNGLRGDTSIAKRIKLDLFYIENWTFLFDIRIIFKTIINGFINKNAY